MANAADSTRVRDLLETPLLRGLAALGIVVLLGVAFHADGAFFKWATHRDMLRYISVFAILACGMTAVIVAGGIDLSVGSVLGLCAVLFARLSIHEGWSPWLAIPATLLAGVVCGWVSGGLVAWFRVQSFIATLAMMVFARGLAKWVSGGQKVSTAILLPDGTYQYVGAPPIFKALSARVWDGNLAVVTIVFLVCLALTALLLRQTVWGRYLYAVGGNEEAARLSGVPVSVVKLIAFGYCGACAALAGVCQAAQEWQGDPESGTGYELTAIAIVVIGGTRLTGGRGGAGLTLAGVLTIGYLEKILSINAVGEAMRLLLTGLIIVVAVIFQQSGKRRTS